jgi:TonB family protein
MIIRPTAVVLCLMAMIACASKGPEYIATDGVRRDRPEAEVAYAESVAQSASMEGARLDSPLKAIYTPFPDYPQDLRRADVTGNVRTRFSIEQDGSVSNATVVGSPNAALAAISLQAVMRWKFEPPMIGGKPARVTASHQFVFRLE